MAVREILKMGDERLLRVAAPVIEALDDQVVDGWEGCLSVPGLRGMVPRHARIRYRGFDAKGLPIEREADGFHRLLRGDEFRAADVGSGSTSDGEAERQRSLNRSAPPKTVLERERRQRVSATMHRSQLVHQHVSYGT